MSDDEEEASPLLEMDTAQGDLFVFDQNIPGVGWTISHRVIQETIGFVVLTLFRTGPIDQALNIDFKTVEGTAKHGQRFMTKHSHILFPKGSSRRSITVRILDDQIGEQESTEQFWVELEYPPDLDVSTLQSLPPIVNRKVRF